MNTFTQIFLSGLLALLPATTPTQEAKTVVAEQPAEGQHEFFLTSTKEDVVPLSIIVELAEPTFDSPEQIYDKEYQQAVQQVQDRLLEDLEGENIQATHRYTYFPMMTLQLSDESQRQQIENMGYVKGVYDNHISAPSLAQSTEMIHAENAWSDGKTGVGQGIVIIDTGVDSSHPVFEDRVIREACFSSGHLLTAYDSTCPSGASSEIGTGTATPCDFTAECAHGTHVAGIAAGNHSTHNGVANDANIIAINAAIQMTDEVGFTPCANMRRSSPCVLFIDADTLFAVEHVLTLRTSMTIASVNMSFGGGHYTSESACALNNGLATPMSTLRSFQIVPVAASANGAEDEDGNFILGIAQPACLPGVVSVGAVDDTTGTVTNFSQTAPILDLLAPGMWITSAVPGGGFQSWPGTSMASPHVAGAVALMRSLDPAMTADTIEATFKADGIDTVDYHDSSIVTPRIDLETAFDPLPPPPAEVVCATPGSGDWVWESDCYLPAGSGPTTFTAPQSVQVRNGAHVRIENNVVLDVNFGSTYFFVEEGSGTTLEGNARIE